MGPEKDIVHLCLARLSVFLGLHLLGKGTFISIVGKQTSR